MKSYIVKSDITKKKLNSKSETDNKLLLLSVKSEQLVSSKSIAFFSSKKAATDMLFATFCFADFPLIHPITVERGFY